MRTIFIILSIIFLADAQAQNLARQEFYLLIGTYAVEGKTNGIHVYRFNAQNGEFAVAQPVTELPNASFLAVSKDNKNVYALSDGKVNAYSFDPASGALTSLNSVPAQGPSYVSIDNTKNAVFAGNYNGGSVMAVRLNKDGSFAADKLHTYKHEGSSVVKERQEKPHVHSVELSPDGGYLLAPDLGADKVYQYQIDATNPEILIPVEPPFIMAKPGAGPRHITFHPNGNYAYLVLELQGAVTVFDYKKGVLKEKQTISMVTPDFNGRLSGADIHTSPDGKFLYASNRGDANEIAIYSIDKNGMLTLIGRNLYWE